MTLRCWLFGPKYVQDGRFIHRCAYCTKTRIQHGRHRWWWP